MCQGVGFRRFSVVKIRSRFFFLCLQGECVVEKIN